MKDLHDVLTGAMLALDRSSELLSLWELQVNTQQLTLIFASPSLTSKIDFSRLKETIYLEVREHIAQHGTNTFFQNQEDINKTCGELYIQFVYPLENSDYFFVKYESVPYPFELHHRMRSKRVSNLERQITRNMIHELLTPINSIQGINEQLTETALNDETKELLSHHAEACQLLKTHISDIVHFISLRNSEARIFQKEDFDLLETLFSVSSKANRSILESHRKLTFKLHYPADQNSLPVIGYPDLLEQLLLHLIDNAIKFTDDGGHINVNVSVCDDQRISFSVSDDGIGIGDQDRALLFRPFILGDMQETRTSKGLGLGLASATECLCVITHDDNAQIQLQSELGQGATFSFEIPYEKSNRELTTKEQCLELPKPPGEYKILVAEDNPTQQMIIKRLITHLGFQIHMVGNGLEAVGEYIRGDRHYDLILMDIQMPGISGHEATELIREHELTLNDEKVPIIAITANIENEVHSQSLEAGMDGHFGKPVSRLVLDKLIRQALLGLRRQDYRSPDE